MPSLKLSPGVNVASLVRCLVSGKCDNVCRICYGNTEDGAINLCDTVLLDRPYCPESVTLAEILTAVAGSDVRSEPLLPENVCASCTTTAMNSYMFKYLCLSSVNTFNDVFNSIEKSTQKTEPNISSLFVVLSGEDTVILVDHGRKVSKPNKLLKRMESLLYDTKPQIKTEDDTYDYQCSACGRFFPNDIAFKKHLATHTNNYMCSLCTNSYNSKRNLDMHMLRFHEEKKFKCPSCDKMFGSEYLVKEHCKAMHIHRNCRYCSAQFTNKHALRYHELSHGDKWPCNKCGKLFKYKQGIKRHATICHLPEVEKEKFICHDCGKKYSTKGTLIQHIRYLHTENAFKCEFCGQKFMDRGKLSCHMSVHTGVKRFQCQICKKYFKYSTTLTYHMRAFHTMEKPYKCDECDKRFITSAVRLMHKRRFHGAPAPQCETCNMRFLTNKRLSLHMKKHLNTGGACGKVLLYINTNERNEFMMMQPTQMLFNERV